MSNSTQLPLCHLPYELLQIIADFLNAKDLQSLSKTCRKLYKIFHNEEFWLHRIRHHFPRSIVQLYTNDIFKQPDLISTFNDIQPTGFAHVRTDNFLDNVAITSSTHYNDDAIERRHAKMYVSQKVFLNDLEYFQYNKPNDHESIPSMKLIYFYLIDRKRCASVNMDMPIHDSQHVYKVLDADSLTGQVTYVKEIVRLDMTGRFQHTIMPGKYEVSWRMKGVANKTQMPGETEFILVPQHGRLLNYKMIDEDFQNLLHQYGDNWFTVNMTQTIIYEPSIVLIAIRNWNNRLWKRDLRLDCIELTIVP
ncbi:unnamed protein product [Adineta ricciae]|uniref:F-box domain-containing protein n=1 Tax=Adineta ricciae TaxID=249248 RepID=A0A814AAH8_ADIRI|nr:unnamed protein product [Adineta ricciae]